MRNATPCRSLTARASFTAASAGTAQRPNFNFSVVVLLVLIVATTSATLATRLFDVTSFLT